MHVDLDVMKMDKSDGILSAVQTERDECVLEMVCVSILWFWKGGNERHCDRMSNMAFAVVAKESSVDRIVIWQMFPDIRAAPFRMKLHS